MVNLTSAYSPLCGTTSVWGSGRVTKGNVPGREVTVLSKRMRFMVRVKSSRTSRERPSEQASRLGGRRVVGGRDGKQSKDQFLTQW